MSNPNPDTQSALESAAQEDTSFAELLSNFEQQHSETGGTEAIQGVIVSITADTILVDIGRKTEGSLARGVWSEQHTEEPKTGDTVSVVASGRDSEGYYQLSLLRVERPKDWTGLQRAFDEKQTIAGTVAEQVKGGFRVESVFGHSCRRHAAAFVKRTRWLIWSARKFSVESRNSTPKKKMWSWTGALFSKKSRLAAKKKRSLLCKRGRDPRPGAERNGFRRVR